MAPATTRTPSPTSTSPAIPFILGCVVAISTFHGGWQLADLAAAGVAVYLIARRVKPPWWPLALSLAILPGLFVTQNATMTAATLVRCFTLPFVLAWVVSLPGWTAARFAVGVATGLAAQTLGLAVMMHVPRQSGLTVNPSELGQVGFMLFLMMPLRRGWMTGGVLATAAITLAAAAARVPLVGIVVFAALSRSKRWITVAVILVGVTLIALAAKGELGRLAPGNITAGVVERADITVPKASAPVTLPLGVQYTGQKCEPQGFKWLGYGAGSFGATTGCVRPHIAPLVAVYELGVFAVIPALLAAWALWTRRLPWVLALTLAVVWMAVDEPLALPQGHYVLAAVLAVWCSRPRIVPGCPESLVFDTGGSQTPPDGNQAFPARRFRRRWPFLEG